MTKKEEIIQELVTLLNDVLKFPKKRNKLVLKFETDLSKFSDEDISIMGEEIFGLFNTLAGDMAYFQPNPILRFGEKGLYGNKKLEEEIKSLFVRLKELGISVPAA